MPEAQPIPDEKGDIRALETFVVDNAELEELEALLRKVNLFEAIGMYRHELKHSDFLSFLLNPRQNHGLGDSFLKRFLKRVLADAEQEVPISPVDVDVWDLSNAEVLREWSNIDILITHTAGNSSGANLAVIIEKQDWKP
jgi:hypothetical protein